MWLPAIICIQSFPLRDKVPQSFLHHFRAPMWFAWLRDWSQGTSHCHDEQKNEEQIQEADGFLRQVAEEPQSPVEAAFRSAPSSHRVASSRSSRVQTTHGGRTNHTHGRVLADVLSYLHKYLPLGDVSSKSSSARAFASPRLYYVIALRRLLC